MDIIYNLVVTFSPRIYKKNCFTVPNIPLEDPCSLSPCGSNAFCEAGLCSCAPGYFGDPYVGCRLECSTNGECSPTKTCQGGKCVDPCPGACGTSAICSINNHIPSCTCPPNTSGDPFTLCSEIVPKGNLYFCYVNQPAKSCFEQQKYSINRASL